MSHREKRGGNMSDIFECLENEKCFLDEIQNIFHNYLRTIKLKK